MIFGKAHPQFQSRKYHLAMQQRLLTRCQGIKKFAFFPTLLNTGRYIWLAPYYRYYHTKFVTQIDSTPTYEPVEVLGSQMYVNYATRSDDHIFLVEHIPYTTNLIRRIRE